MITRSRRSSRIQKLKDEAEKAAQKIEKFSAEETKVKRRKVMRSKSNKQTKSSIINSRRRSRNGTLKVESPNSDSENKKQKLPAYKVQQIERLQRLVEMSSIAKPRGPVTYEDYNRRRKEKNENQLKLILDKNNKYKISNVTNYDPVRQQFINGELRREEIDELSEKYEKIQRYKNIKVPKLEDDIYLRRVLREIVESNQSSRFWEYYTRMTQTDSIGDAILVENERKLNLLMKVEERSNIKNAKLLLSKKHTDNEYEKIDLKSLDKTFDLDQMVQSEEIVEMEEVSSDAIFEGLEEKDYKEVQKF